MEIFLNLRRMRGWQEMKSPTQETARSSVRSSMSDLSSGPSKDMPSKYNSIDICILKNLKEYAKSHENMKTLLKFYLLNESLNI